MLGEVVIDAKRVAAVVEEVLAHRAARVGGHVLDWRRLVGGRRDDDRVVQRPVLVEQLDDLDHGRHPLADRDVDADQVLVAVVDDRVERDRGLAGLAVADDQLALAAADRDHAVDRLEPRLNRRVHGLALDDTRRLELGRPRFGRVHVALVVERASERVDEAAEQLVADRDLEQATGALHRVALHHLVPLAEQDHPDVVLLEVEGEPGDVVRQLEHLQRHAVVEPVDAGYAVGYREHRPDLGEVGGVGLQSLDPLAQDLGYLVGLDFHVCLAPFSYMLLSAAYAA